MKAVIKSISVGVIFLLFFSHCSTTQVLPGQYTGSKITFGSGGGFSGAVKSFTLLDNGAFYKNETFKDSTTLIKKMDMNLTRQIFSNYEILGLSEMSIDDPGNLYTFVTFDDGSDEHKLVWSGKSHEKNLNLFYNILKSLNSD